MKRLFLPLILVFLFTSAFKSNAQSCCSKPATGRFADLALNNEFVKEHDVPLPFVYQASKGEMIKFKTADGKEGSAFEVKADKPENNYVFLFHEWWGLNDYIKKEAEKLQEQLGNVNVIALDLFDGKTTSDPETAGKYMKELKEERAIGIIKGAMEHVGNKANIATIGWCFGGGWSLQAAIQAGKQATACVMFYGMPETDLTKLKKLNAEVLGIFAGKDQWITPEIVKGFEKNMKDAGKKLRVVTFDADHAFANPSNPKYNEQAAVDANNLAVDFLKEQFTLNSKFSK